MSFLSDLFKPKMLSLEQIVELSNFLNTRADLPVSIQEIAASLKEFISPIVDETPVVEEAPVVSEEAPTPSEETNG